MRFSTGVIVILVAGSVAAQEPSAEHQGEFTQLEGHALIESSAGGALSAYDAVAAVSPGGQQVKYSAIDSRLRSQPQGVLFAWATDDSPVGPRIGINDVPESTLKALANFELQRRSEETRTRELEETRSAAKAAAREAARDKRIDITLTAILGFLSGAASGFIARGVPRWWRGRRNVEKGRIELP